MDETKKTQIATVAPQTNEVDPVFAQIEGELKTRFELLPTELQQVILSSDYQMKLFEIAKKHKLTYEKLGQLELETTMVILGMTPPDEYKAEVAEQMQLSGTDLDNVVMEINAQVFQPIRDKLMGIYTEDEVKKGEEFAQVTTNPNAITEKPSSVSPENKPASGIQMGNIPTGAKNTDDAQKETTPVTKPQPASFDPYRELPDATLTPNTAPTTPVSTPTPTQTTTTQAPVQSGINTKITDEFLKTIPVLGKDTKNKSDIEKERGVFVPEKNGASEVLRTPDILGATKTNSASATKVQTQSETLQNIADLKSTLSASLTSTETPTTPIPVPAPEPVAPTQEIPVVAKEIQSATVANIVSPVKTTFAPLPNIVTKAPTGEVAPAEVKVTPKFSPEETGELVRNIKLQIDENKNTETSPVATETLQKIDSMIDFKKAGNFMNTKEGVVAHVGENFAGGTFKIPATQASSTTAPIAPSTPTPPVTPEKGHIFDNDINDLKAPVKKTGFFSKMKNFFSGKEKIVSNETNTPAPIDTTVHQFTGMPTNLRPESTPQPAVVQPTPTPTAQQQTPVPPGVDDVKIFDEVTVVKK